MRRVLIALALAVVVGGFACSKLWPERWAVNAPVAGTLFGADAPQKSVVDERLKAPTGFSTAIYAEGIEGARMLKFTPAGDLLVSSPRESTVFLVERDADGDGKADGVRPLLKDLDNPHGLELVDGWLYVAEEGAIKRVRLDADARATSGSVETVLAGLPEGGNHWRKVIGLGPDGWLYVAIGSTCNVCVEEDERRAAIGRLQPDGTGFEIHARGLRNSAGFDWRPADGALYATDNGRDLLGDDFPPCELNRVEGGRFYGWPFVNGFGAPDPDLGGQGGDLAESSVPPAHGFAAHTAPLGIDFYGGEAFPERYRGQAFVALHGSWNRTEKSGYKVVLVEWPAGGGALVESDFLTGFEVDEDVIGRPVDVRDGPDGALYVSDDFAGVIYRVWHHERAGAQ